MTVFSRALIFLLQNKNTSFMRRVTYPPGLLGYAYNCAQRTYLPGTPEEQVRQVLGAADTYKHFHLVFGFPSWPVVGFMRFPPSLIVFSAS